MRVVLVSILILFSQTLSAQDSDVGPIRTKNEIQILTVDLTGKLHRSLNHVTRIVILPSAELLQSEMVRSEIELTSSQEKELESLLVEIARERTEQVRRFADSPLPEADLKYLVEEREDAARRLGDILLPHQLDRLDQLLLRSQMHRMGLIAFFGNHEEVLGFQNSYGDHPELRSVIQDASKRFGEELSTLSDEIIDELLEPLTESQIQHLKEYLVLDSIPTLDIDLLVAQIQNLSDEHQENPRRFDRPAGERTALFDIMRNIGQYRMTADGGWSLEILPISDEANCVSLLRTLLSSPEIIPGIALTSAQLDSLSVAYDEYRTSIKLAREQAKLDEENRVGSIAVDARMREMIRNGKADLLSKFRQTITSDQRSTLENHFTKIAVKANGIVFELVNGNLGSELDITPSQVDLIKSKAESLLHKRIIPDVNGLSDEFISSVQARMAADDAAKFQQELGRRPKHVYYSLPSLFRVPKSNSRFGYDRN